MRSIRLSQAKVACLVLFICLAAILGTRTSTRNVVAAKLGADNFNVQGSSTTAPTTGKFNGKIVFASDRKSDGKGFRLWTMNSDGSNPKRVTEIPSGPNPPSYVYDENAKWSPDGSKVAFKSIGRSGLDSRSIYVMNADGSDIRQVAVDFSDIKEAVEMGRFEWSPDGTKFLFDAGVYIIAGLEGAKATANLFTSSLDGKTVVRLTNDKDVMNGSATWSPDGKMIAFVSNSQEGPGIQVMNADGSNRHTIAIGSFPTWSPDSSKILFVGPSLYGTCPSYVCQQLYTVNPDGSGLTQVTHYAASYGVYSGPRYSPDGKKIVFERDLYSVYYNITQIFVMDADGNNQVNISNRPLTSSVFEDQPDWQPVAAPQNNPAPSVLGFSDGLYLAPCFETEISVTRSGNLNEPVSCAYQTQSGTLTITPVSVSFAPGETSKRIPVRGTCDVSFPTKVSLVNNDGNSTFVGGIKNATVVFGGDNPIDNSAFFVRQHYRDFLNREPDPLGWDYWTANMDSCLPNMTGPVCKQLKDAERLDTSAAFFLSIEFRETGLLVYYLYKAAYGNLPGAPVPIMFSEFLPDTKKIGESVIVGQNNWQQRLETNKQEFALEFVWRSRFIAAYPTALAPSQFVDALFANAGVVPSTAERQAAIDEFAGAPTSADNTARARALRQVAENLTLSQQEFNRAFVLMQYFGYLRRNPNDAPDLDFSGYNFWLNKLNQFNGDYQKAEMVKAFITSGEYRTRFGP